MSKKLLAIIIFVGILSVPSFAQDEASSENNAPQDAAPASTRESQAIDSSRVKTWYKNGKMTEWQLYDENGRLTSQIRYKNDNPTLIQIYDSNGGLREGDYKVSFSNGNPRIIEKYRRGVQLARKGYYESGQLRYEMQKKKDGRRTKFKEYSENGSVKSGEYKEYYGNGQLKGMGSFKKGLPHGHFVSFCENGQLAAEKEFSKGRLVSQSWEKEGSTGECEDMFSYLTNGAATITHMTINKI